MAASQLVGAAHFERKAVEFNPHVGMTVRSLSTLLTPGVLKAAAPASFLSPHDQTLPNNVTVPLSAVTLMFPESISAFRRGAFSISSWTADGWAIGPICQVTVQVGSVN